MRKRFCAILTVLVLALLFSCPVFAKGRTIRSSDRRFEVEVPTEKMVGYERKTGSVRGDGSVLYDRGGV